MKKYLEYSDGKSDKFWVISVKDSSHTVHYGRIGTSGQTKTKEFASKEEALKAAEKLADAKIKKGYAPVQAAKPEAPSSSPQEGKLSQQNKKILALLSKTMKKAEMNLAKKDLSSTERDLLQALSEIRVRRDEIIKGLVADLVECFGFWVSPGHNPEWETPVDFIYFEWSGRVSSPYDIDAGAWGFFNSELVKNPGKDIPQWGPGTFDYCGSLDLGPILEPLCTAFDNDEEIADELLTLYSYQVAEFVNQAFEEAKQSPQFDKLVLARPVSVYLAEHEEIPIPAYSIE